MINNIEITQNSLDMVRVISDSMSGYTFHHHYHILFDIRNMLQKKCVYVEIGTFAGGSATLMASNELETDVISIDLGYPIKPSVVYENVEKFKSANNTFTYIQGNSTDLQTVKKLKEYLNNRKIDILFIDGDHSYNGVISDYNLYNEFVAAGGYIIFDDYMDSQHSPEVYPAVNDLVETIKETYNIIGTLPNTYNARPETLTVNNCFIIQKK
jgi:cephalosporin hydroxylase